MTDYEAMFVTSKEDGKVRILGPWDWDKFYSAIPKPYLQTITETLFWLGCRYIELERLHDHEEWYLKNRKTVHFPRMATKKVKRVNPERYISPLPPQLISTLPYFFKNKKPPARDGWNQNMKRWAEYAGFDPLGFSAKTTRKTLESWMYAAGVPPIEICLRQGHTELTSLQHYAGIGFTREEKEEIKRRLKGWMIE